MPDVPYVWNETHVDVLLKDKSSNKTVLQKNITGFFTKLEVVGLSKGNVTRMDAGFDSIHKILNMSVDDFLTVDGFKTKATKVHTSIHTQIEKVGLARLMAATNLFGRGMGERRIQSVDSYPNILVSGQSKEDKIKLVADIDGFAKKTAALFVDHIDDFLAFAKENGLLDRVREKSKSKEKSVDSSHPLFGKSILMTGFRNKPLEEKVKEVGGKIASAVSKKTDYVVVVDMDETTGKADKVKIRGSMILVDDFKKKFDL